MVEIPFYTVHYNGVMSKLTFIAWTNFYFDKVVKKFNYYFRIIQIH